MEIITPVTDYIPASTLTTDGDIVMREAGAIARLGQRTIIEAYRNGDVTVPTGAWTKVEVNQAPIDVNSEFDTDTNYRWNVDHDGTYKLYCQAGIKFLADNTILQVKLRTDAPQDLPYGYAFAWPADICIACSAVIWELSAGDYVDLWVFHNHGGDRVLRGQLQYTHMCVYELI